MKYQTKAEGLKLNKSTDVGDYINQWSDRQNKVLVLDEEASYSERNLILRFQEGVVDPGYGVTKHLLIDEKILTFDRVVT